MKRRAVQEEGGRQVFLRGNYLMKIGSTAPHIFASRLLV
jgi:hypothetical protein